jgi:hypothetical protein
MGLRGTSNNYYSGTQNKPEINYCITRRELLPIVRTLEHFLKYLYRWIQRLQKYSFSSKHCLGWNHNSGPYRDDHAKRSVPTATKSRSRQISSRFKLMHLLQQPAGI